MEDKFRTIVEQIFNNWTAIRLAVEHGMGGPNSRQVAVECVDYMTQFCLNEATIQVSDIKEALEDILDEEFDTICEDNSPFEVASLLHRFSLLIKEGNLEQCELEYQNLPTCNPWLSNQTQMQSQPVEDVAGESEEINTATPMEEDSEWTTVKSRRKK
ncbi:hypothetical protein RN001_009010 [Aquatica leii]|uniref:Pre-rRNA-processing protein TSR2 homolog n=1 Tax=Aquatica leii TaxID=1421715 RepID=A0AAN7P3Y7_9COLE|nr:hypothetical protein RN001_009010 [Aquatica leii]